MIRAIDNKPLDMSDDEYEYYKALVAEFGINTFRNLFESDETSGFITLVKPPINNNIQLGVIFFLFNLMLNQRVREYEELIKQIKINNNVQ